jgi:cardiolipin synthase
VIPVWVTALVITRDVVIVMVALLLHLAAGISRFPPSPLSKINTAVQVAAVIVVLLSHHGPQVEDAATYVTYLVALLTIGSGVEYIVRAHRMAAQGGS